MKKQRNNAFDLLCGICIIRMIMLHITGACGFGDADWWTPVMHWSYYFMSFFFFKAGYFNKTVSGNTGEFIKNKAKRLLIPYAVWGSIGNLVYFFFVIFILDPANSFCKDLEWKHVWMNSQFWGNIPCWFLFSFFMAYVFAHLISKVPTLFSMTIAGKKRNVKIHWLIFLFPYFSWWLYTKENPLPMSLNNVFMGIFLFYLGRVWHFAIERMGRKSTLGVSAIMLIAFILLNIFVGGEYSMSENTWKGESAVITPISIALALCGLSGLLLKSELPRIPVLGYIGEHSMVFFVTHDIMLILYKMIRSANVHSLRGHWDDYTILILVIFSLCFLLVPHVEKVSWLSGRFKK